MEEENKNNNLDEIMKDSTLSNPELTFCEKTTYLDFLLSNAKTEEEKEDIKRTINDFLEISKEEEEEETEVPEDEADDEVEIEKVEADSEMSDENFLEDDDEDDEENEIEYQD